MVVLQSVYNANDDLQLNFTGKSAQDNLVKCYLQTANFRDASVAFYVKSGSKGFKVAGVQKNVEPGLSANFVYHPVMYVAIVQAVKEGIALDTDVQSHAFTVQYGTTFQQSVCIRKVNGLVQVTNQGCPPDPNYPNTY